LPDGINNDAARVGSLWKLELEYVGAGLVQGVESC